MEQGATSLLCIGQCRVEMVAVEGGLYRRSFAGEGFGTAVYLARQFGDRLTVSFMSALGTDRLSDACLEQCKEEGLETEAISRCEGGGLALSFSGTTSLGDDVLSFRPAGLAAGHMLDGITLGALIDFFSRFDVIYLTGTSLAILGRQMRSKLLDALQIVVGSIGCRVAYDPYFRPALWPNRDEALACAARMTGLSQIVCLALADDEAMHGKWIENEDFSVGRGGETRTALDVALRWRAWGADEVLIAQPDRTCFLFMGEERQDFSLPPEGDVVDRSGARDAFVAGYLGSRLIGTGPAGAIDAGHAMAEQVKKHPGSIIDKGIWRRVGLEPSS